MKKAGQIFKNRYILILAIFAIWLVFFDQDNLIHQLRLSNELKEVRAQQEFYQSEYKKDSILLHQLENDMESQEKMAREKYLMKKDDETIFLIVDDDEKK